MVKFSYGHINAQYRQKVANYRGVHQKLHEIPFNSANKWQISLHKLPSEYALEEEKSERTQALAVLKGAPERVLRMCTHYVFNGNLEPLTEEVKKQIMDGVLNFGGNGERVLAMADMVLDADEYDVHCEEPSLVNIRPTKTFARLFLSQTLNYSKMRKWMTMVNKSCSFKPKRID